MKTEVDLAQLAQAINAAILLQFEQLQHKLKVEPTKKIKDSSTIVKKKRGRPKKKVDSDVELAREAEEEVIVPYEKVEDKTDFTAPPRKTLQRDGGETYMKKVPFRKKVRINQWVDDLNVARADMFDAEGNRLKYPEHTEPRPPQKKLKYRCDICNRQFEAFSSYLAGSVDGESQPQIRCYDCNSRR